MIGKLRFIYASLYALSLCYAYKNK